MASHFNSLGFGAIYTGREREHQRLPLCSTRWKGGCKGKEAATLRAPASSNELGARLGRAQGRPLSTTRSSSILGSWLSWFQGLDGQYEWGSTYEASPMYQASSPQGLWLSTWSEYLFRGPERVGRGHQTGGQVRDQGNIRLLSTDMQNEKQRIQGAGEYLRQDRTCRQRERQRKRV